MALVSAACEEAQLRERMLRTKYALNVCQEERIKNSPTITNEVEQCVSLVARAHTLLGSKRLARFLIFSKTIAQHPHVLFTAVRSGAAPAAVELLLKCGACPNIVCAPGTGETAATLAARLVNMQLLKLLLECGGTLCDANYDTVLHISIRQQNLEMCQLALQYKCDPNLVPNSSLPILSQAIVTQNIDMVKALIAGGADVNMPSFQKWHTESLGYTPMHFAAAYLPSSIDLLHATGGKVDSLDRRGKTPLHLAVVRDNNAAVQALLRVGAAIDNATLINRARGDCLRTLLDHGADIHECGECPVSSAMLSGRLSDVVMLVDAGADFPRYIMPLTVREQWLITAAKCAAQARTSGDSQNLAHLVFAYRHRMARTIKLLTKLKLFTLWPHERWHLVDQMLKLLPAHVETAIRKHRRFLLNTATLDTLTTFLLCNARNAALPNEMCEKIASFLF